jgi:type IV pilus assembly protein PilW
MVETRRASGLGVSHSFCPVLSAHRLLPMEAGVSLVEMVFAVGVATTVVLAAYTLMSHTETAAVINDQTAEMQMNARVAMELITKDLKGAGFGMNGAVAGCATALVPADNNPAGADTGPDSVSVVAPTPLSTLANAALGGALSITLQPGAVAAMTPSGFGNGSSVSLGGVWSGTVANIAGDTLTLNTTLGQSAVFPAGTQVYWLQCVTYTVLTSPTACSGNGPCLLRNGAPIADGIEDLQIAYACDGCVGIADGVIDDQPGSAAGFDTGDFVSDSTWANAQMTAEKIRLARINVVARQMRSDPAWISTAPVAAEDHNPATDPGFNSSTYQQNRRRLYTRTVQVRNLGL